MFPTCITIMSNWFPKNKRGFLVGLWATANNVGNILGIQIAHGLIVLFDNKWQYLLMIISICIFCMAWVIFFFLVPEPEHVGIVVAEYDEDTALVDAIDSGVVDKIVEDSNIHHIRTLKTIKTSDSINKGHSHSH